MSVPPPKPLTYKIVILSFLLSLLRPSTITIFITSRSHRDPVSIHQGKQSATFGFCRYVSKYGFPFFFFLIQRLIPVHQNGYVSLSSLHVAVPSGPNPTVTDVTSHF